LNTKKNIAVLLDGPIYNDYRVIKMIKTLSEFAYIDLFYVGGDENDSTIFNNNVNLNSLERNNNLYSKIVRNSFFYLKYTFMIRSVLNKNKKYCYVLANDLPTLYPAARISKKLKAKLIYDSHEIYLETLNQFFPKKTSKIKSIIIKMILFIMKTTGLIFERFYSKKVHHFITVNHSLAEYFKSKYDLDEVSIVMNFPSKDNSNLEKIKIDYRQKYGWAENDRIFIYQGILNEGRGLKLLIKAFNMTSELHKLVIIGDGVLKSHLQKLVSKNNLNERVKFIDKVSLNVLPNYTKAADYGVNLLEDFNLSKKLASPNKLFEYIHAEIPIICSSTPENNKVLNDFYVGISTSNELTDIAKNVESISKINIDKFNFKEAKKAYSWENQKSTLYQIFNYI